MVFCKFFRRREQVVRYLSWKDKNSIMWLDVSKKVLGQEIDMRFLNSSLRNWFFSLFFWLLSKTSNRIELFFLSLTMKMQLLEINYRKKKNLRVILIFLSSSIKNLPIGHKNLIRVFCVLWYIKCWRKMVLSLLD